MKLYHFLSFLFAFLLSTVGNPLTAIDNNAQLDFTQVDSPSFAGNFDSRLPPNEAQSSTVQADTNADLNPLLFSTASEDPTSQIKHFSQTSIVEESNSGSDGSDCDEQPESEGGSKNVNKYRIRRDGAMCAVKEEDIDWDRLWATFSKTKELTGGEAPACVNPTYPVHLCCRGPQRKYVHNRDLVRVVKNCFPYLMLCARPYLNLCCQTFEPLSAESPGYECINADTV